MGKMPWQTRPLRLVAFAIAAVASGVVGVVAFAACGGDSESPTVAGVLRDPPLEVGAVTLPDVTESDVGVPFAFKAAPGELLVTYFGFTNCPDLCPTTMANVRSAKRRLGEDA